MDETFPVTFISPAPPLAVEEIWKWVQASEIRRVFDDFSRPQDLDGFKKILERERISNAFIVDGTAAGVCLVRIVSPVTADCGFLFRSWGEDWCSEAIRRAFNAIFQSGFQRIQSTAFADDRHSINAFEAVGGKVEGTLRRYTLRNKKRVDVKNVSVLREEFFGERIN